MPGKDAPDGVPSAKRLEPPPALGPGAIAVLEGLTFLYSDSLGDVPAGSVGGMLHEDTRYISEWVLTVDGAKWKPLRSHTIDHFSAAFFLTNPETDGLAADSLSLRRTRAISGGLTETLSIHSYLDQPVRFELRMAVGADFADLFEVKTQVRDRSSETTVTTDPKTGKLRFAYEHEGWSASVEVTSKQAPDLIDETDLVWQIEIPARGKWHNELGVTVGLGDEFLTPRRRGFLAEGDEDDALARWQSDAPRFESDAESLEHIITTSIGDLGALRIRINRDGNEISLPAAGLPWFMTLFGRDTLITAFQTMWVGPQLAQGALLTLAMLQGKSVDDFRDEEPGKIQHEIRFGELTVLGEKPHSPYYGNTDATQLFLILLSEYWRWTGDEAFVRSLWDHVSDALTWIDQYGDMDRDGFIEYQTRSYQGLGNMCWKDSWNGVQFADGRIPYLPIAIAEAQGYAYDAKVRVAEMAEALFEATEFAEKLRKEAEDLKTRFNDAFWIDAKGGGYYAIGLDGDKQQIDTITSNMGHLLWSGIVPEGERAEQVVKHLVSPEMFSGWGIRTMSEAHDGFNPIGYHVGTVWPHDNSIAAMGLERYGFRDEANLVALALLDAASYSEYRLPEAFAGFGRDVGPFPVPFPTACSPQAWATGAPFLFVRTMLGMHASGGEITLDPNVPEEIGRLAIHGMHAFGTHWDVEANGTNGHVRLTH